MFLTSVCIQVKEKNHKWFVLIKHTTLPPPSASVHPPANDHQSVQVFIQTHTISTKSPDNCTLILACVYTH